MRTNNELKQAFCAMPEEEREKIMCAFRSDGGVMYRLDVNNEWVKYRAIVIHPCDVYAIEVKPEPKYRHFKDASEVPGDISHVRKIEWEKGVRAPYILSSESICVFVGDGVGGLTYSSYSFKSALNVIELEDGTPFGVKVEEE